MPVGFLYCAANNYGHLKLGFSLNPEVRMVKQGGTKRPDVEYRSGDGILTPIWTLPGTMQTEKALHRSLARHRVSETNEWYPVDSPAGLFLAQYFDGAVGICYTCNVTLTDANLYQGNLDHDYCLACGELATPAFVPTNAHCPYCNHAFSRSDIGRLRSQSRTVFAGGRPQSDRERCYCQAHTMKRARSRCFDCCRKAGIAQNILK